MGAKWITPMMKQSFVVAGVALNMGNFGSVFGFTAILLPQLRHSDSPIQVDITSESWIASIVGISLIVGNLLVPTIMGKFGRKLASLFSCLILLICWLWMSIASNVTSILVARFFQGFSLGINLSLSPIMVGELTSPLNRGFLSSAMTSSITAATLVVHVLGSFLHWQTTALICGCIAFTSFSILIFSPESPSWLVEKGRYEDSRKSYRWLRGDGEDEELDRMIEARKKRYVDVTENKSGSISTLGYFINAFKRKEFYKPVIIMIHLYSISLWAGMSYLIVYTLDVIKILGGEGVDVPLQITILDFQRLISTCCVLYAIKMFKRRKVLFFTVGLNVAILVITAAYAYAKTAGILPFDHPAIGMTLLHIHMCSMTIGALPLPIVISGELFPQEFRGLAGGISAVSFSVNYFITSKTAMGLLTVIGIHGAYLLYGAVTFYCLVVVGILLPETKDKTLQEIEEKFKGKPELVEEDLNLMKALTSLDNKEDV